jgi:hypothetical protein
MIAHTELACIYHGQHQIIQATLSEPLPIKNGFHCGDALACLLFNTALQKVIRGTKINTRGSIFYKSVQIFVYADDDNIVGQSQIAFTS